MLSLSNILRYQASSRDFKKADATVQHILPLLLTILNAPFATTSPTLLQASVDTVQTIIVTAWPRIGRHRGEMLRGMTICWCRIEDEEARSSELEGVQESIRQAVQLLNRAMTRKSEIVQEYQTLIRSDNRLRGLLCV